MTVELLAGLDVSSKQGKEYLGGIVGLKESITSTHKRLGYEQIHMRTLGGKTREIILGKLIFDLDYFPFCIRTDRNAIIGESMKSRNVRHSAVRRMVLEKHFDRIVYSYICVEILPFLQKYKMDMTDFSFECDIDCKNLVRRSGGRQIEQGIAHDLADIIAWSFTRGKRLKSPKYSDKSDKLLRAMADFVRKQ
ncbi:hypothetical protein CENSYa_0804 [Cenarchaeum symbiosum A]|uniref:Uncharacterized protein n=1 Tax=Cenarchaeum symbiosum (strain A) TaxID=414004 RepID=A0RVS0_CENSY|nr:hypothetical protein CENSYa_0804 [Cenarchaeum symbiosum A]